MYGRLLYSKTSIQSDSEDSFDLLHFSIFFTFLLIKSHSTVHARVADGKFNIMRDIDNYIDS